MRSRTRSADQFVGRKHFRLPEQSSPNQSGRTRAGRLDWSAVGGFPIGVRKEAGYGGHAAARAANLAAWERIGQGMETGRLTGTVVEKSRASNEEP